MSFLPIIALLLAQEPASLAGTVVDRDGRPVAGLEIVLTWDLKPDGTVPILGRATTDAQGRYALAVPRLDWPPLRSSPPALVAYRKGEALLAAIAIPHRAGSVETHLTVDRPGRRTFTLRDRDGRPIEGARIAPRTVLPAQPGDPLVTLPDDLMESLRATSGADGRATLDCLAPTTRLLDVNVTIPGVGSFAVNLPPGPAGSQAVTLDLKPAGAISGRVLGPNGKPLDGAQIQLWSLRAGVPLVRPVHFESGTLRTGPDGTFRTPQAVLAGSRYRVLARARGIMPALTDWVAPMGKEDAATTLPDIRLSSPRSITGRVVDRRHNPVAGAEVVAGGENISAKTDEQGRYQLDGLAPGRTLLVVRRDGFRINGKLLGPDESSAGVVLARFDELSKPMHTLGSPLPLDERRKLARRVLDPFLVKVLKDGRDAAKDWALRSLLVSDPGAALEALERTTFQQAQHYQSSVRGDLAAALARSDLEEAAAVAESVPMPARRAAALVAVCSRVPDSDRARKRQLADRALLAVRAEPDPKLKVWQIGGVAELLLDLGETDRAKAVFAEGLPIAKQLGPDAAMFVGYFASSLARVDLPAALALLGGEAQALDRADEFGEVAERIAASNPAEAERLIGKIQSERRSMGAILRACRDMAKADPPRARRIASNQETAGLRAGALVATAYGLAAKDQTTARELIRRAIAELDQPPDPSDRDRQYFSAFMPAVEAIDPTLVPELFWREVASLPDARDPRVPEAMDAPRAALLLARYDREAARAVYDPAAHVAARSGPASESMTPLELWLLAVLDANQAAALVEAMPEPKDLDTRGANWLRIILADQLGRDDDIFWDRIRSVSSGLGRAIDRSDPR